MPIRSPWIYILLFCACFVGSSLVGGVVFGSEIFEPQLVYFQFIVSGAISGAVVAAHHSGSSKAVAAVGVVTLFVFLVVMKPGTGARLLRDLVLVPTLMVSVWGSIRLCSVIRWQRFGSFVFWGAVFGASHLAMFGILTLANGMAFDLGFALVATRIGGLVGVGVGLGRELIEFSVLRPTKMAH